MRRTRRLALMVAAFTVLTTLLTGPAHSALPETLNPADFVKPICPKGFENTADPKVCTPIEAEIVKMSRDECEKSAGLKWDETQDPKRCAADGSSIPKPDCKPLSGYSGTLIPDSTPPSCRYERAIPVSAIGDYIGDCLKLPTPLSDSKYKEFIVTHQTGQGKEDRELTLVPGSVQGYFRGLIPAYGCRADESDAPVKPLHIHAGDLMAQGATRHGYAYGVLVMPYKFYRTQRSFQTGLPIGGYLGWRSGQAGSGTTMAMALTLSSVKADTVDPKVLDTAGKPTVTGSADVPALSGAIGVVFDIWKSPEAKPFKAGLFIGKDYVNSADNIDYKFNRRTWIAVQLGYDFTDN